VNIDAMLLNVEVDDASISPEEEDEEEDDENR